MTGPRIPRRPLFSDLFSKCSSGAGLVRKNEMNTIHTKALAAKTHKQCFVRYLSHLAPTDALPECSPSVAPRLARDRVPQQPDRTLAATIDFPRAVAVGQPGADEEKHTIKNAIAVLQTVSDHSFRSYGTDHQPFQHSLQPVQIDRIAGGSPICGPHFWPSVDARRSTANNVNLQSTPCPDGRLSIPIPQHVVSVLLVNGSPRLLHLPLLVVATTDPHEHPSGTSTPAAGAAFDSAAYILPALRALLPEGSLPVAEEMGGAEPDENGVVALRTLGPEELGVCSPILKKEEWNRRMKEVHEMLMRLGIHPAQERGGG
ncbi:hypothetical protein DFJ73DRAFT_965402 [Zopfochytrium polystomum]|nr:hypothetical protein DFJ73DRAFT_965402 [Zopfochytrium polystomum]